MGRLATTRMFAGVWLCEVSGPRGKVSLESVLEGERRI